MSDPVTRLNLALEGRYRIERELGEGGMATVYLADDLKHERQVALKVLKPELAAVVGAERFLTEIKTTANLQHPNILPLFDSDEADGFLYYVMPFIDGESLRERLERERQLPVDEAVRIATDLAEALDYAHRQGVVHRDIKPANVMLHEGRPLLADFGIALAAGAAGGARLTETGLSVGTPYYMSPEQATGEVNVGPASDMYALGCVLYEALVGEPPYPGASAQAVLAKVIQGGPVSATAVRATVPLNVDAAIRCVLEKLPADRFTSAQAFAKALSDPSYRHGELTTATIAAPAGPWRTAAVVMMFTAITLGGALAWSLLKPDAPRGVLRYTLSLPIELGSVNDFGSNLDISPDGTKIVFAGAPDGSPRLWIRSRDDVEPQPIPGTELAHQPFFSPSGDRVGFVTENRELKIVSLTGEPPVTLADSSLRRGGGAWGPEDYLYYSEGDNGEYPPGLRRVPAAGGPIEVVTTVDTTRQERRHYFPDVLPSGKGVVFAVARQSLYQAALMDIAVGDLSTGEHEVILQGVYARWSPTGHILFVREDGALMAAPFDEDALELTGPAVPLFDGIEIEGLASVDLDVSANGTLVYAVGGVEATGQGNQVVRVSRNGVEELVDPSWIGLFARPSLSPDGSKLAISIIQGPDQQIWIKQLDRGPLTKLTFEGNQSTVPVWTPDGLSVAYMSAGEDGSFRFYKRRADGSRAPELVLGLDVPVTDLTYSPDGEWIAYRAQEDLFAVRVDGEGQPIPIGDSGAFEGMPAISPDGRWIAYVSAEGSQLEVFVRPFPNVQDGRWQVSTNGGTEPVWARGGGELYFKSSGQLMALQVLPSETFVSGEQRQLFPLRRYLGSTTARRYDVTPDDQHFLMLLSGSADEAGTLMVVENFSEELLAKMGL
jgi:serine/threonine-protein kinase